MVHNNHGKDGVRRVTCMANSLQEMNYVTMKQYFRSWNMGERPMHTSFDRNRLIYSASSYINNRILRCEGSSPALDVTSLFGLADGKEIVIIIKKKFQKLLLHLIRSTFDTFWLYSSKIL